MKRMIAILIPVMMFAGVAANAYNFGDVKIEQWVGGGSNSAVVVVDFGSKSYAFGYNWEGTKSGADMIVDINSANIGMVLSYSIDPAYGIFVSDIAYNNQAKRATTGLWPGWSYYNSTDGESWSGSFTGASDRTLVNGTWDAWNYTGFDPITYMATAPDPVTPMVPEPSSIMTLCSLIGLAGSAKLLSFRRK
ncbi:MAG: hypothetical protein NT018_07190 [Armatimonadetes bacterium]|nr:hypothetical protein [Armatimonadota bacterium]